MTRNNKNIKKNYGMLGPERNASSYKVISVVLNSSH